MVKSYRRIASTLFILVLSATPAAAYELLRAAVRSNDPVIVHEHKLLYTRKGPVQRGAVVELGKASIERSGSDVTIVSFSRSMIYCLDAAEVLAGEGIDAEVIDLRTLRPLDMATIIESVKKTNRIITVEEAWPTCSVGSEICASVTR